MASSPSGEMTARRNGHILAAAAQRDAQQNRAIAPGNRKLNKGRH